MQIEGIPKDITRDNLDLSDWCILSMYRGSIAHGMYTPNSIDDKDVMAVCVPPLDYYFGLSRYVSRGTREIFQDEWDIVIYEAKKMLGLLAKGNPNVLAALWLEDEHYLKITEAGQLLIDNRDLFSGRHVYRSFTGYANSQLKRMTKGVHLGYMGQKRKQLVEQFGYDTKNAAHLIRLLRMGIEFLSDGVLHVKRKDAQQLLQIKYGEWDLEQVKTEARRLFSLAEKTYTQSKLPDKPDMDQINNLCTKVIQTHLNVFTFAS